MIGAAQRLRPKTAVTHVGTTVDENASGTTVDCALPVGSAVDDFALFSITYNNNQTCTKPDADCIDILVDQRVGEGGASRNSQFWRRLDAADISAGVISFTISQNNASVGICSVYRNVGGFSVKPYTYTSINIEQANSRTPRAPSMISGPQDMVVVLCGNHSIVNNATAAEMTTPPSGLTLRGTGGALNSLNCRGASIASGVGSLAPDHMNYACTQAQQHTIATILALSPVKPRSSQSAYVPSSLAGKPLVVYSTSSNAYVRRPELNWGYNSRTPWGDIIDAQMGPSANYRNMAMPGAKTADICSAVHGTRSYSTRAVSGDGLDISRAPTLTALPSTDALFCLDVNGNDVVNSVDSAQTQTSMVHATRAIINRIRTQQGGAIIAASSGSITYGGTWTSPSSDGATGGAYRQTTVPGSTATVAINNTTGQTHPWEFVLMALDNTALGGTGSTYRLLLDGVQVATGTTHNQAKASGWGGGADYKFHQMIAAVNVPTGNHTIVLEHTGSSGHFLNLDSVQVQSLTPPWIGVNVLPVLPAAAYTTYPELSVSKQNAYAALIAALVAEYTDGRVILYDPSASGIVSGQSMYFASDDIHQKEALMTHYAWEILQTIRHRIP